MRRISLIWGCSLALALLGPSSAALAKGETKKAPPTKKAPVKKEAPKKLAPPLSAAAKKNIVAKMGPYKWGMTKDEILSNIQKDIDAQYDEKIKATTDIPMQDRLRKEKKTEFNRIAATFTEFNGKKGGWDVSIIEEEFAHNTGEAMLEKWEKEDGKNNRRFFFFKDGKLWKMYIQLDVSILPEDKRNFDMLKSVMVTQYGNGDVEGDHITWHSPEFDVRAVDKLKAYGAIALAIEDPKVKKELLAEREAKAPPKAETNPVIKAIVDTDKSDHPDVKNNTAVDAVIQAHGGSPTKKN